MLIYSEKIQKAIEFAIKVHCLDKFQVRKVKKIPYITHPLCVGMILAKIGAPENVIIAGILHDSIEDSTAEKKVTKELLRKMFGSEVAEIVNDVTEPDKSLSWEERKDLAINHISKMIQGSVLVKSADVLHNITETLNDYSLYGESIFKNFSRPKNILLYRYKRVIDELKKRCQGNNPLIFDLETAVERFGKIL